MSLGSSLQLLRGRGHCSQRSPRRAGCSRRSSAPPRGLLQRPPRPWGRQVCRGAAGTSAGEGRGSRRDRRTRGALPPSHPPSRVPGPRQPPCPPLTLAPRRQSAEGSRGCSGRGSRLHTGSLRRQPAPQPPSLPSPVRAGEAGERPPEPPESAGAAGTLPQLVSAEKREAPPRSPRRFSVERITPPYRGCRLPPPGKRGGGHQGGKAPCQWLLLHSAARFLCSASPWTPWKEQVPALHSAPVRPTIAPVGSGAPASLQPRAHAGLPLSAAPGRRPYQHCCPT